MTRIFLIRHGQTDPNRLGLIQGQGLDAPLNATGRAQAEALGARFASEPLDAVVASPLVRALATAEAVAAPHGLPVALDAGWMEMHWGTFEGRASTPDTDAVFQRVVTAWQRGDFADRVAGGEPLLDVQARLRAAWERLLAAHRGQTVAVVSHGRSLRVLLASLLHPDGLRAMQTFQHANTSVNEVVVDDDTGNLSAARLNCIAHLDLSRI